MASSIVIVVPIMFMVMVVVIVVMVRVQDMVNNMHRAVPGRDVRDRHRRAIDKNTGLVHPGVVMTGKIDRDAVLGDVEVDVMFLQESRNGIVVMEDDVDVRMVMVVVITVVVVVVVASRAVAAIVVKFSRCSIMWVLVRVAVSATFWTELPASLSATRPHYFLDPFLVAREVDLALV